MNEYRLRKFWVFRGKPRGKRTLQRWSPFCFRRSSRRWRSAPMWVTRAFSCVRVAGSMCGLCWIGRRCRPAGDEVLIGGAELGHVFGVVVVHEEPGPVIFEGWLLLLSDGCFVKLNELVSQLPVVDPQPGQLCTDVFGSELHCLWIAVLGKIILKYLCEHVLGSDEVEMR